MNLARLELREQEAQELTGELRALDPHGDAAAALAIVRRLLRTVCRAIADLDAPTSPPPSNRDD